MSALAVFTYANYAVRTITLEGEPWFVARDVLDVLNLTNPTEAIRGLDDDEFSTTEVVDSAGRRQPNAYIVNEPGLYSLILRSRKPEAKAFKRWVTHDVLPAIRRTGRYATAATPVALPDRRALALMVIEAEDRAAAAEQQLQAQAPAVEAWQSYLSASGDMSVADAAKALSRHPMIQLGGTRLFDLLKRMNWVYRGGDGRLHPYQRAVDAGWLAELAMVKTDPDTRVSTTFTPQIRVTAKGFGLLHQRLSGGEQLSITAEVAS